MDQKKFKIIKKVINLGEGLKKITEELDRIDKEIDNLDNQLNYLCKGKFLVSDNKKGKCKCTQQ